MYENYEKYDMLECYIESNKNSNAAGDLYFNRYPERRQPFRNMFGKLQHNLRNYGSFAKPRTNININQETQDERELKEITVLGTIPDNGKTSIRKLESETGIPRTNIWRILKTNKMKPYRTRKIHHLVPDDYIRRTRFCEWFIEKTRENELFALNCIWTDEASVSSAGIFNRYNEYTWSRENPHVTVEVRNQGRFSFNVWVGIYRGQFIGPYIYDGALNSQRYLQILQNHVEPFIEDIPINLVQGLFFQHDGAPPHCAGIINNYLNEQFGENWMANQGPIQWPARSPDLTPLDFFLWGKIKDLTYKQPFNNRRELEDAVLGAFNEIQPLELINATKGVRKRCRICLEQNGRQFEHLLT
jgi:Helix-turn-helix domain (DUF4817)